MQKAKANYQMRHDSWAVPLSTQAKQIEVAADSVKQAVEHDLFHAQCSKIQSLMALDLAHVVRYKPGDQHVPAGPRNDACMLTWMLGSVVEQCAIATYAYTQEQRVKNAVPNAQDIPHFTQALLNTCHDWFANRLLANSASDECNEFKTQAQRSLVMLALRFAAITDDARFVALAKSQDHLLQPSITYQWSKALFDRMQEHQCVRLIDHLPARYHPYIRDKALKKSLESQRKITSELITDAISIEYKKIDVMAVEFNLDLSNSLHRTLFAGVMSDLYERNKLLHNTQALAQHVPALFTLQAQDTRKPEAVFAIKKWLGHGVVHWLPPCVPQRIASSDLKHIKGHVATEKCLISIAMSCILSNQADANIIFEDVSQQVEQSLLSVLRHMGPLVSRLQLKMHDANESLAQSAYTLKFKEVFALMHEHGYTIEDLRQVHQSSFLSEFNEHMEFFRDMQNTFASIDSCNNAQLARQAIAELNFKNINLSHHQ